MSEIFKIAGGIIIAGLVLGIFQAKQHENSVSHYTRTWQQQAQEAEKRAREHEERMHQRMMEESRSRSDEYKFKRQSLQYERENAKLNKEYHDQLNEKRESDAVMERVRRQVDRQRLWNEFYQEPEKCLNYPSDEVMMECTNYRIQQKRKFEEIHGAP